jgi:hypothetical protein
MSSQELRAGADTPVGRHRGEGPLHDRFQRTPLLAAHDEAAGRSSAVNYSP